MRKETKKEGRYKCCLQGQSTIIHFMHSTTWVCSTTNNSRDYLLQHFVESEHILLRCTFIFWNVSGVFKTKEKRYASENKHVPSKWLWCFTLHHDYEFLFSKYTWLANWYCEDIINHLFYAFFIDHAFSKTNPNKTFNWDLRFQSIFLYRSFLRIISDT